MSNYFKVTRALPGNVVSAIVNFTAPRGLAVQFDPTKPQTFGLGTAEFVKATATGGFFLEREVLTEIPLTATVFPQNAFLTPEKVGNRVTARKAQEIEVEGLDLVLTSGTGAIGTGAANNAELGLDRGKWRLKQSGDELAGWLREKITAVDAENITGIRVEIPQ